jgi:hypothetical protein
VLKLIRVMILVVLAMCVLSVVMAIARPETGPFEKVVLAAAALGLTVIAAPVRRIGTKA